MKASGTPRRVKAAFGPEMRSCISEKSGKARQSSCSMVDPISDHSYLVPEMDRLSDSFISSTTTREGVADQPIVCNPKTSHSHPTSQIWRR
jgi:hypothetical protein